MLRFVWGESPGLTSGTTPQRGQRFRFFPRTLPRMDTGRVLYLHQLLRGGAAPGFPGHYVSGHDPHHPNNFLGENPALFRPQAWIEVMRACAPATPCQYPLCDDSGFWSVVSPGSGLFLNTGQQPLVAHNRLGAYHTLLVLGGLDPGQAWDQMAQTLRQQDLRVDVVDQMLADRRRMRRRVGSPGLVFRQMGPRPLWQGAGLLGLLGLLLFLLLALLWPVLLVGLPLAAVALRAQLTNMCLARGLQTVRGLGGGDLADLLRRAASAEDLAANGLATLRVFDRDMVRLATQQGFTTIMLASQPNLGGSWLPEVCHLRGKSQPHGLCSDLLFRYGEDGVPGPVCSCCESPGALCAGCPGHVSGELCRASKCLPLVPDARPCRPSKT